MSSDRLSYAIEHGLSLGAGNVLAFGLAGDAVLSGLGAAQVTALQPLQPDATMLGQRGVQVVQTPSEADTALVTLPRARELAQHWIAQAAGSARALVVVDGAKTDGVETLLKAVKARVPLLGQVAKAHGKVFWFAPAPVFDDWLAAQRSVAGGFVTVPGVFSADGPDPASELLAVSLPASLGRDVADFGAGWGYLSKAILGRDGVETLHLVEADARALDCARQALDDTKARFHWADATTWDSPSLLDCVVMNPPFHIGRKADPALGRAFIQSAARNLQPSGHLWLVANRHLAYETTLTELFRTVDEVAGSPGFKVLHAAQRIRTRR